MQFLAGGKIIAAECSWFEYFSYISLSKIDYFKVKTDSLMVVRF